MPELKTISVSESGTIRIVQINAKTVTESSGSVEQLGRELFELTDHPGNCKGIALSVKAVSFLDSAGIGKLITFHKRCQRAAIALVFYDVPHDVYEMLRTMKLHKLFSIVETEEAAVAALNAPPPDVAPTE